MPVTYGLIVTVVAAVLEHVPTLSEAELTHVDQVERRERPNAVQQ